MIPILYSFNGINVYSYGLMIAVGYALGTWWIIKEADKDGLSGESVFDMLLIQMVVGILGSRFLYIIEYIPQYLLSGNFFAFESGGLTFYGAVFGSILSNYLFVRYKGMPFWRTMDCVGMGLPLGAAFARLGCFLNGCCHGIPCTWPWGIVFPRVGPTPLHPTQVYESLVCLMVFFAVQWYKPKRKNYGEAFVLSLGLYGFGRFFIEFWRGDNPVWMFSMTLSQWIGMGMTFGSFVAWKLFARAGNLRIFPPEETVSSAAGRA